ncbi:hypothetical protein P153DRAFT_361846 [Dothidotthia symphoricarpi CBS 119687]|uniref:Uncharacterized protein n=1 Tax=Dothidotthia symphoricarpi CBS 119687 TaxID=1392245 RepID=A0A6A5ZZH0_9PLEO|nr:uncharacterized protein P153DRAFT_361846 [Dothidotthia symphoricarpi CBS 119687]KAF2123721.1 hypothetical protein P153DRAFT_361846 [Dothidotthia symphoricarpi CBS 119687]
MDINALTSGKSPAPYSEVWHQDETSLAETPNSTATSQLYNFDEEFGMATEAHLASANTGWPGNLNNWGNEQIQSTEVTSDTAISSIEDVDQFFSEEDMHASLNGVYRQDLDLNNVGKSHSQHAFQGNSLGHIQPSTSHAGNHDVHVLPDMTISQSDHIWPIFSPDIIPSQHSNDSSHSNHLSTTPPVADNASLIDILMQISEEELEAALQKVRTRDPGSLPRNMTAKLRRLAQAFKPSRVSKKPITTKDKSSSSSPSSSPSRNNTPRWWSRFLDLTPKHLTFSNDLRNMIATPAHEFLNYSTQVPVETSAKASYLSTCVMNMRALRTASTYLTILSYAHCLFFHILSFGTLSAWHRSRTTTTIPRLRNDRVASLYDTLALPISEDEFAAELREWRHIGSCLAFFAQRLGLGCIVVLSSQLGDLKGCSKGGESVCWERPWGGIRPSEGAFAHLERIGMGKGEEEQEAEDFMQDLLFLLFSGVPEFFEGEANAKGVMFERIAGSRCHCSITNFSTYKINIIPPYSNSSTLKSQIRLINLMVFNLFALPRSPAIFGVQWLSCLAGASGADGGVEFGNAEVHSRQTGRREDDNNGTIANGGEHRYINRHDGATTSVIRTVLEFK